VRSLTPSFSVSNWFDDATTWRARKRKRKAETSG
jgi:hypothetical protein